jgi:outer membrane protein OmpA-like peptidoglycan-associated protein
MSETLELRSGHTPQARALMVGCLLLGVADLVFIDAVVLPRALRRGAAPMERAMATPGHARPVPARPVIVATAPVEEALAPARAVAPTPAPPAVEVTRAPVLILVFDTGQSMLDGRARALLDALAVRAQRRGWVLAVEGHADARGDDRFNDRLSLQRAQGVAQRLRARGLAPRRMQVTSFGATRPASAGEDQASLRRNRRVEVLVVRGAP